jgi:hypothetical protein
MLLYLVNGIHTKQDRNISNLINHTIDIVIFHLILFILDKVILHD